MSPPVEGDSTVTGIAGVKGTNNASGNGIGVLGTSENGEAVHGETKSTTTAAVAGFELNTASPVAAVYGEHKGDGPGVFGICDGAGPGVFGTSKLGEGLHGESSSTQTAAVGQVNRETFKSQRRALYVNVAGPYPKSPIPSASDKA